MTKALLVCLAICAAIPEGTTAESATLAASAQRMEQRITALSAFAGGTSQSTA